MGLISDFSSRIPVGFSLLLLVDYRSSRCVRSGLNLKALVITGFPATDDENQSTWAEQPHLL
jgi:hypothetical protein